MSRCRTCDAPILWVETEATEAKPARRMPLDADPENLSAALQVNNGNIVFIGKTSGNGTPIVRFVKGGSHRTHFVSCPDAAKHRRPR